MGVEDELKVLKDDLGVTFVFIDDADLFRNCESFLDETNAVIADCCHIQLRNFHVQRDAIMKYRKEKNFQLCKQEKTLMDKTVKLNDLIETSQREKSNIHCNRTQLACEIDAKRTELQSLEAEEIQHLKEHDENIQSLERLKKSLSTAVSFYVRFLGMEIINDVANSQRFYVEFNISGQRDYKIPIIKNNDGYTFADGVVATTGHEFISRINYERKLGRQPHIQL